MAPCAARIGRSEGLRPDHPSPPDTPAPRFGAGLELAIMLSTHVRQKIRRKSQADVPRLNSASLNINCSPEHSSIDACFNYSKYKNGVYTPINHPSKQSGGENRQSAAEMRIMDGAGPVSKLRASWIRQRMVFRL